MVHISLLNEYSRSYPGTVVDLIKHLKGDYVNATDTAVENRKTIEIPAI